MSEVYNVKKKLESMIQNFIFAGIEWKPLNNVQISKNKLEATTVFLETLEDNDDVQSVYTNLKFINN
jgi:transcriptional/translational regulatory protein YebC/TACO1